MLYCLTKNTPIGPLEMLEQDETLVALNFRPEIGPEAVPKETPLLLEGFRQLDAYFAGQLTEFDLPLAPRGTEFQRRVWDALCAIPYGETISYRELAARAGNAKAFRAAGMANHRNPLPIYIPCHRVIGSNGSLTGYGGGLPLKRALLELERTRSPISVI